MYIHMHTCIHIHILVFKIKRDIPAFVKPLHSLIPSLMSINSLNVCHFLN